MSAHVTSVPSCQVTPSRSVKAQVLPPFGGGAEVGRHVRDERGALGRVGRELVRGQGAIDRAAEEREVLAGVGALRVDLVPLLALGQDVDRAAAVFGARSAASSTGPRSPLRRSPGPPWRGRPGALVAVEPPQAATSQRRDAERRRRGSNHVWDLTIVHPPTSSPGRSRRNFSSIIHAVITRAGGELRSSRHLQRAGRSASPAQWMAFGSRASRTASPKRLNDDDQDDEHCSRDEQVRRDDVEVAHRVREHRAEGRFGRQDADAEERERGLQADVGGQRERRVDEDRRPQVRQDLREQDPPLASPPWRPRPRRTRAPGG